MKRIIHWIHCAITGHNWKETDVYHIEYMDDENDYSIDSWYVTVCSRYGKRHA